jgi:ubiquinone biosynthesis protein
MGNDKNISMNPSTVKRIFSPFIRSAARRTLVGRNRSSAGSEQGRFSQGEVDDLLQQTWQRYDVLAADAPIEADYTYGNRMNVQLAVLTYAALEVFQAAGIPRAYAVELIADLAWKIYEKWGAIPTLLARLLGRHGAERMRFSVHAFLRFPFSPPAYRMDHLPSQDGVRFDVVCCPIALYFRQNEAADLCQAAWCDLDYGLAEMWGGRLERTQTIAAGCDHCDFHFRV